MRGRSYRQNCALAHTADIIGERWTLLLLRDLLISPRRFRDLMDSLKGIGSNLLSQRLRSLEACGLVEQRPRNGGANEYALTAAGEALEPAVLGLVHWGLRFAQRNRDSFHHQNDWDLLALKSVFQPKRAPGLVVTAQFRSDDFTGWFEIDDGRAAIGLGDPDQVDIEFAGTVADVFTGDRTPADRLVAGEPGLMQRFLSAFALHA